MRNTRLNLLKFSLLGLVVATALTPTPLIAQVGANGAPENPGEMPARLTESNQPPNNPSTESLPLNEQVNALQDRLDAIEQRLPTNGDGPLGLAWSVWLSSGSYLIGLISLVLAAFALHRGHKQRGAVFELNRRNQSLLARINGIELQLEQEKTQNRRQLVTAPSAPPAASTTPSPLITSTPKPTTLPTQPEQALPSPSAPAVLSKSALIASLNAGDRQQLREAAKAELNITTESENAIATGRSMVTELEEVPGGGSYWLVALQEQHWLFPTERTLKGFAAAQPSKGLFHYDQKTIAQPQLIEPALLEHSGKGWSVKTMGIIAVP